VHIDEVTRPDDARLDDLADLLMRTFQDPNSVLGADRIREFLSDNAQKNERQFCVLVAEADDGSGLVGCSVFSYVVRSNCGFSEYLVVERSERHLGLGRALFDRRRSRLDAEAARHGRTTCHGLFIEADSPARIPPELLATESMDTTERLRMFRHFGFRRVSMAYVQPPLATDKAAVDHMDLLFAGWDAQSSPEFLPTAWLVETLAAIWQAWSPATADAHLADLRATLPAPRVPLVDALSET
jgi:hypothetical protein